MGFIYGWLVLMITSFQYSSIEGLTFSVSTYGVYPNDNIDDTNAIQSAVDMAIQHGSNNVVVFGSGTYTLSSAIVIVDAINLTVTGQGMYQTLLLGTAVTSIFLPSYSLQLTITSLSIDFDPLSFTARYVINPRTTSLFLSLYTPSTERTKMTQAHRTRVNVTDTYLDLQVQPPHQADIGLQVPGMHRYDLTLMRPAIGPQAYQKKQIPLPNVNTSLVSPGILRIPLASRSEFIIGVIIIGDTIVARYCNDMCVCSLS